MHCGIDTRSARVIDRLKRPIESIGTIALELDTSEVKTRRLVNGQALVGIG